MIQRRIAKIVVRPGEKVPVDGKTIDKVIEEAGRYLGRKLDGKWEGSARKTVLAIGAQVVQGQAQLALQLLDVLIQAESENLPARRLRIELLERLGSEDYCLMSRNAWVYFIERDREFLRSRGDG